MQSFRNIAVVIVAASALAAASIHAQTLDLSGATLEGSLTGQTLLNTVTAANDGNISTWVVSDSSLDSQGYIFIYQLQNEGPDEVTGVNFNKFNPGQFVGAGAYSNVVHLTLSGSLPVVPLNFMSPSFTFDTITGGGAATFNGGLDMGDTSWFEVVLTDVSAFTTGYALSQDDFQANGTILAPNFATFGVPEPSSSVMLLAGVASFYGLFRFRRAANMKR
jgi:hypothetical protein